MRKAGLWGKPVVVLGDRELGLGVWEALRNEWQLGFKPVGIFDDRPAPEKGTLKDVPYGRSLTDAVAMAEEYAFDTVIFTMPRTPGEQLEKLITRGGGFLPKKTVWM